VQRFSLAKGVYVAVHHELCGACHDDGQDVQYRFAAQRQCRAAALAAHACPGPCPCPSRRQLPVTGLQRQGCSKGGVPPTRSCRSSQARRRALT
jgi:hypothetical protein